MAVSQQSQSSGPVEPENYQVTIGSAKTVKEYDHGVLIRSIGLSFENCTLNGVELLKLLEEVFEYIFDALHGKYDDLSLNPEAIWRYEFKSSSSAIDFFGFQEKEFKQANRSTLIDRLMQRANSERVLELFRSVMLINVIYTPR
uniref:Uncharacterized protein n=1 Tax=Panagrolaimus superbus TaxID=310955 RepID=A0A914YQ82_9BILA